MDLYTVLGQLGYRFPRPMCDSRLSWEFHLGAGAGFFTSAAQGFLYLDYDVYEHADASQPPPERSALLVGNVMDITRSVAWDGIVPLTASGSFPVAAQKESVLYVDLLVTLWSRDGLSLADGMFQLYAAGSGGFTPGVRYRLEPVP